MDKNPDNSGFAELPAGDDSSSSGLRIPLPAVMVGLGLLAGGAHTEVQASVPLNDNYFTQMNTVLSGQNVTSNDTWESNSYSTTVISDVSHGTLALQPTGVFTYTPDPGFFGTDTFTYRLNEVGGSTFTPNGIAQVTISVTSPAQSVPALGTAGLAGLGAAVAALGARRRRRDK